MQFLSMLFRRLANVAVYLAIAVALGVAATVVESYVDNMLQLKEIERTTRHQIKQAVHAYQAAHLEAQPQDVAQFLNEYVTRIMPDVVKVVRQPKTVNGKKKEVGFIWSFYTGDDRLDIYLRPEYIAKEATGADFREMTDGILVSFLIFLGLLVYAATSERAKLERLLHEEERLKLTAALHEQEAFALLGRMTATLSHELRTPVATISNLVQTLPARVEDARFTRRFIEITREELTRMQRMIDNLLLYGKDLKVDKPEWVEVEPLLTVLARSCGLALFGATGAIYGDAFYLQLLFTNLLRNSADAGAHAVTIRMTKGDDEVFSIIEYEDDGEGFSAGADLAELRSPFVTTRSKGAGLGLYLAEKIVRAHGGVVELYRPSSGAGVRIWLPVKAVRTN